jgi:hypothetical protein
MKLSGEEQINLIHRSYHWDHTKHTRSSFLVTLEHPASSCLDRRLRLSAMGLSQRKDKQKIAPDPRNLGWSQGEWDRMRDFGNDYEVEGLPQSGCRLDWLILVFVSFLFNLSGCLSRFGSVAIGSLSHCSDSLDFRLYNSISLF